MITISGEEVQIVWGSLSIEDALEERTTCSFTVVDKGAQLQFQKGQPVEVVEDGTVLFSGVIDTAREQKVSHSDLYHGITCIDWHYLTDKRIIAKAYEQMTAGDIVRDILDNYLSEEGITPGTIMDGPFINEAVFNYVYTNVAMDSLAEKAGFWWMVDFDKKLYFVARATYEAPFTISDNEIERDSLSVEQGNPMYRNKQYIKGGRDVTDVQVEHKLGDGENQSFVVGYPVAKVPTIEVSINGGPFVEQTRGIRGLEEGRQWYWSKGDSVINQDESQPPLTAADRVRITYQGEFSIVVVSINQAEVVERQTIEGSGTGIVEDVADEPYTESRETAFQSASAKLAKYGVIGRRVVFRTWKPGLATGQLLRVNFPLHRLHDAELLIEAVSVAKEGNHITYSITAVEGPITGSWAKMFYAMATRGQAFVIRENISDDQVLITLEQFFDGVTWSEAVAQHVYSCPVPSVLLYPSATLYPC